MKKIIKMVLRAMWRLTSPARRPFVRKIEAILRRCNIQSSAHVNPTCVHFACEVTEETGLLMDHLIREVVRLQVRIEILQQSVEDLTPLAKGLVVARDIEEKEDVQPSAAGENIDSSSCIGNDYDSASPLHGRASQLGGI